VSQEDREAKLADAIDIGLRAAKVSPKQARSFGNAFVKALYGKTFTTKEIKEMMQHSAWEKIDEGLRDLMKGNDELSPEELKNKSKRLKCLADFSETLKKRVNERISGVNVGPIEPLFKAFFEARDRVDETTN